MEPLCIFDEYGDDLRIHRHFSSNLNRKRNHWNTYEKSSETFPIESIPIVSSVTFRYKHFNLNTFLDEKNDICHIDASSSQPFQKYRTLFSSLSQNVDELLTLSNFLCQLEIAFLTFFNVSLYQLEIK